MPRGDGTGPLGQGPMTGRGRGYCITDAARTVSGFLRRGRGLGRGLGSGRGQGRGLGRWSDLMSGQRRRDK